MTLWPISMLSRIFDSERAATPPIQAGGRKPTNMQAAAGGGSRPRWALTTLRSVVDVALAEVGEHAAARMASSSAPKASSCSSVSVEAGGGRWGWSWWWWCMVGPPRDRWRRRRRGPTRRCARSSRRRLVELAGDGVADAAGGLRCGCRCGRCPCGSRDAGARPAASACSSMRAPVVGDVDAAARRSATVPPAATAVAGRRAGPNRSMWKRSGSPPASVQASATASMNGAGPHR